MGLILLTLFGACCTLLAIFSVVFFDVPALLVLQVYLGYCATLVAWGLIMSLVASPKAFDQRPANRKRGACSSEMAQSRYEACGSQDPLVAPTEYTELVTDYHQLGPIRTADVESDRS